MDQLRSNANYFGSTRLIDYLQKMVPDGVQKQEEWQHRLGELEKRLAESVKE